MREAEAGLSARAWAALKGWLASLGGGSRSRAGGLSLVGSLDLGAKKSLWMVAYGERRFLVAGGAESIAAMLEIGPGCGRSTDGRYRGRFQASKQGRARRMRGSGSSGHPESCLESNACQPPRGSR